MASITLSNQHHVIKAMLTRQVMRMACSNVHPVRAHACIQLTHALLTAQAAGVLFTPPALLLR